MTIYIEPEYVTRLEDEKKILNHKLSVQLSENTRLRMEKKQLKQELFNLYLKHYN